MKILIIRGKNLASLAGEFEIDLEDGPLKGCGLFAISGATGSGKSTLLDAVCLALFDRIPRLANAGRLGRVGRADEDEALRLAANDVRHILRRGAGNGYAEVVFRGSDGRRYRSRWTVRRARDSAAGRYQNQTLELEDLDSGQRLGGTRTETLREIEKRLGLSFDQFCRSALLAQGAFAAFLQADQNERAELLERITGTDIYSRLSQAAHARCREEREALARLERELTSIPVLDEAARAAAQARLAEAEARAAEAEEALKRAAAEVGWYVLHAQLLLEERAAEEAVQTAQQGALALAEQREEVAKTEAAQGLRHPVSAADAAARALGEGVEALTREAAALAAAAEAQNLAKASLEKATGELEAATGREREAQPALQEAERLDAEQLARAKVADEAHAAAARAQAQAERARKDEAAQKAEQTRLTAAARSAGEWLSAHEGIAPLAAEWPRWKKALEAHAAAWTKRAALEKERQPLVEAAERAAAVLAQQREKARLAEEAHVSARSAHGDAVKAREGAPLDAVRAEREEVTARRTRLERWAELLDQRDAAVRAEGEARAAAEAARAEAEARRLQRGELEAELNRVEVRLEEAQRALDAARAAQSQSSLRASLRDGEPCPVCGATNHPLREEAAVDALVVGASSRVSELETEQKVLAKSTTRVAVEEEGARTRSKECLRRAEECASQARALVARLKQEEGADAGAEAQAVRAQATALVATENSLRAEESRRTALARSAQVALEALERAREGLDGAQRALRDAESAAIGLDRKLEALEAQRIAQEAACAAAEEELSPALSAREGWLDSLRRDAAGLIGRCAEEVDAWEAQRTALARAEESLAQVAARLEAALAQRKERETEWAEAESASVAAVRARDEVRAQRAGLLGGEETGRYRAALREACSGAERMRAEAARWAGESERAQAQAQAREAASRGRLQELRAEQERSAEALAAALENARMTEAAVRSLLERDVAWLSARKGELAQADAAVERAKVVLGERRAKRAAHEAGQRPSLDEAAARAAQAEAETAVRAVREEAADARASLKQDDLARERVGARRQELEAQRAKAEVWQRLDALIGSSDGNKLKVFAQSLTLDALLGPANQHLSELAPRYRLMRVPHHDLELQIVDADMGEEIRSVMSLSGGETFLVSLALALGLASLSSSRTQVETLFIDEGFGTLDPETLELALSTLDALQAGGRQIGIISHVSGLAERIGAQVRLEKLGGGRSRIRVLGPEAQAGGMAQLGHG